MGRGVSEGSAVTEPAFVAYTSTRRALTVTYLTTYARRLPFVRLPDWAFRIPSHTAFRTYAALLTFADLSTGVCWPSHAAIANAAGLGEKTARRALDDLRALGVVAWERRHDAEGQASNRYAVAMDPAAPPAALAEPVDNSAVPVVLTVTPRSERPSPLGQIDRRNENQENKSQGNETRASAPAVDARCSRHRGVDDPPACRGCRDARIAAEASAATDAEAERSRRAAALVTLDPAAVQALSRHLGGVYSAEAITEAARAEMPGNLPLGLRMLASRADAADAIARWER
ncbi:helix-turn-helix domain-containing protein [Microbacterium lushaniae]|nr:helix-turn-helix domain-containing protein [Microbacterium lushaniae]KAA9149505.1 helix-turn-helix domain-containing protein [Microbacterium lushaniae]